MNALGFTEADGDRVRRRLELNWFGTEELEGARVQLLSGSPDGEGPPLVDVLAADYPDGFYTTDIELPTLSMEELGWAREQTSGLKSSMISSYSFTSRCVFPYWIVIVDGSDTEQQLTAPRCMQSEPTWMRDNYELFKDLTLGDLMLVYTHDAAAYK